MVMVLLALAVLPQPAARATADTIPPTGKIVINNQRSATNNRTVTISQDLLHHGADYTPWEGYEVKGWPVKTILRGDVVFDDGKVVGKPGGGRFLKRALSPYAVPNHTD